MGEGQYRRTKKIVARQRKSLSITNRERKSDPLYTKNIKQKIAAQLFLTQLKNDPHNINLSEILIDAGYSETTAKSNSHKIVRSPGFILELEKVGFTREKADKTVASIMNDERKKPADRLKAADMVYRILGAYAPEKHEVLSVSQIYSQVMDLEDNLIQNDGTGPD